MTLSDQDILKKMEEMVTVMIAFIIERLHHLKGAHGKKKKVVQESQDEDSIFDDDCFEEKEAEINKEPKKKEKSKETKEMSQEIKKMKGVLKRSQGMEDYMLDIEELCPFLDVQLPPKFKMPKMDSFDCIGNLKNHLKQYALAMKPLGLTMEKIILCSFRTFSGVALQWYLSLENVKMNDWNKTVEAFAPQYSYNVQLDVSLRDLETTKQLSNESFFDEVERKNFQDA